MFVLFGKSAPHWVILFPITSVISSETYHIELPEDFVWVYPTFHISYLQPYVGLIYQLPSATLTLVNIAIGEYVEDILDSRFDSSCTKYLIKWVRYHVFESI